MGDTSTRALAISTQKLNLWYGTFQALFDINLNIGQGIITSMIGPSGCGKSTLLRSVNRINERLGYVRITGSVDVMGEDIYQQGVELVQVRKQVGMVFQRPNPLPISIRDNVLFSHRLHTSGKCSKARLDEIKKQLKSTAELAQIGNDPCRVYTGTAGGEDRSARGRMARHARGTRGADSAGLVRRAASRLPPVTVW